MTYLLTCVLVLVYSRIGLTSFCYWNSGCPYKYFSDKTPYDVIRGDIRDSAIHIKGCEPIGVWVLARHGKINPGIETIKNMEQALIIRNFLVSSKEAGKCSLCAQDVENLENWSIKSKMFKQPYTLSQGGYNEMKELGARLKQAFPKLLANLEERSCTVQPIVGDCNENSAKAFVEGLDSKNIDWTKPKTKGVAFVNNDDIAPYEECIEKYLNNIRNDKKAEEQATKYFHNLEFLAAKDRIQRRSGIDYKLTDDNITALYDLCRYESSDFDKKFSPWCALFTSEDLKVLEYIGDLKHYYRSGYGISNAKKLGHLPLIDLLKTFKQVKENKGKKLTVYITNGVFVDLLYTTLGLFKDEVPLTGTHRNPERRWRSSKLSSFSSNVIAVLNRCATNELDDFNVVFYVNEEPLLTVCNSGICTWEEFEEKLTFHDFTLDLCDT